MNVKDEPDQFEELPDAQENLISNTVTPKSKKTIKKSPKLSRSKPGPQLANISTRPDYAIPAAAQNAKLKELTRYKNDSWFLN